MGFKRGLIFSLAVGLACVTMAGKVMANGAGSLDRSFAHDGRLKSDFMSGAVATAVASQPDGKILVAGYTVDGEYSDFVLVRYLPDGRIDPDFGETGRVLANFDSTDNKAYALAIQPDGKIVLAGGAGYPQEKFALARFTANGSVDAGFGKQGKVLTDFGPVSDRALTVAIAPDGRIVAGGYYNGRQTGDLIWSDSALARYNPDGSLDDSFGKRGKVMTIAGNYVDEIHDLAIQTDGKIVVATYTGAYEEGESLDFSVMRFLDSGDLDSGFGKGGRVITDLGAEDGANAIALQDDGKILLAGYSRSRDGADFAMVRYTPDGVLDSAFGERGKVLTDFFDADDEASAVAVQKDGKIVLAGRAHDDTDDFAMARYTRDGKPDRAFGRSGKVVAQLGGRCAASLLAIQKDGKMVAAVSAIDPQRRSYYSVARYLP